MPATRFGIRVDPGFIRSAALLCADVTALLIGGAAASLVDISARSESGLRYSAAYGTHWQGWGGAVILACLIANFGLRGHYTMRVPPWLELKGIVLGTGIAVVADFLARTVVLGAPYHFESGARWLVLIPAVLCGRYIARVLLQQNGLWTLRTLMIGDKSALHDVQTVFRTEWGRNYDVVATTDLEDRVAGTETALREAITSSDCRFIVVAQSHGDSSLEREAISVLERIGMKYARIVSPSSRLVAADVPRESLSFGSALTESSDQRRGHVVSKSVKAALDILLAVFLLVLSLPIFAILFWIVRVDGGPALYGHQRIGVNGRRFRCMKFRTMVTNSDDVLRDILLTDPTAQEEWATKRKLTNDPRITSIGSFLRTSSLDELPQLINVIRGEMSFVGPRPIVEAEAHHYGCGFAYYCDAKPGITGLWQVSGRSSTSYRERVALDVWYVQNWSLWRDLVILFKTVPAVLLRRGAT